MGKRSFRSAGAPWTGSIVLWERTCSRWSQQGVTDTDNSNLKQLRRASALERIVSTSMGGTPQAPKLNTIAGRLAEREAFVNKAESAKNSLVTSDTYEGGKTKAVLGEVKASSTVKSGVDSMNSVDVNNKIISGNLSAITDREGNNNAKVERVRALERKSWNGRPISSVDLADDGNKMLNDSGRTGEFLLNGQNLTSTDYSEIKNNFNKATVSGNMRYVYVPAWGNGAKIAIPANETFESFSKKAATGNYLALLDNGGYIKTANKSLFGLGTLKDERKDISTVDRLGQGSIYSDNN